MNLTKLKQAEAAFFEKYPEGFNDPSMLQHAKKHKMDKMIQKVQTAFAQENFQNPSESVDNMVKIISQSSLVSVFEKPKLRDFVDTLSLQEREFLASGLQQRLHGAEQDGFNMMADILKTGKLAKWSLISIIPVYFKPQYDVYVKPTAAKNVIEYFEIDTLKYHPTPTWEFYEAYRNTLHEMKSKVDPGVSPNNAAFTGFLMMNM